MEIHKPREKEKRISERRNNNARMGRVLHETAGRKKRRKGRNTNEGEADDAGGTRNHTNKELKKRKAPGRDRVQNEAWMYGIEGIVERMVKLMNGVWRGEGFPVDWREGVVCRIFKKGEKNRVENYRGITLLNAGYKL
jgi:hypothetical protein